MSVTQVPTRTWTAGAHTFGPVSKPAGASLVSIQVAANATTDWQTGAAGRTLELAVQFSTDSGVTWRDRTDTIATTPDMGKAGALPTILEVDVSADPTGTQYQMTATFSANMGTGFTITVA